MKDIRVGFAWYIFEKLKLLSSICKSGTSMGNAEKFFYV